MPCTSIGSKSKTTTLVKVTEMIFILKSSGEREYSTMYSAVHQKKHFATLCDSPSFSLQSFDLLGEDFHYCLSSTE